MRTSFARLLAIAAMATLALAACGSSSKKSNATTATTLPAETTTVPAETTTTAGTAAKATVSLASVNSEKVGSTKVLVDADGKALYVWDNDKTPGKSSCTGACEQAWPPYYVTGTPTYGAGVDASLFSTIKSEDGDTQLAVNGKPLYLWASDKKAGDATGQGIGGFYVVAADGKKIDKD
jgi:predicted lipoprotein with Yx(FWY)xxD motif